MLLDRTASAKIIVFIILYMALVILDQILYLPPNNASAFSPSNGIFIAFLLFNERRHWLPIITLTYAVNISVYIFIFGSEVAPTFIFGLSDVVVCSLSAYLTHHYTVNRNKTHAQHFLTLLIICVIVVPAFVVLIDGFYSAFMSGTPIISQLQISWSTVALGTLFTLPLFIHLIKAPKYVHRPQIQDNAIEVTIILLLTLILGQWIFSAEASNQVNLISQPTAMFPLLIWSALRLKPLIVCIQLFMVSLIVLGNAKFGIGPFFADGVSSTEPILAIQGYLAIIGLSTISLATVVAESRHNRSMLEGAIIEAESANKAKSDLLARTSHELRTPLNAIIGFSEMMRLKVFGQIGSPKYEEYAADINDSSKYLLQLVNDILDLSKANAGEHILDYEFIAPKDWLADIETIIKTTAHEKNIQCHFNVSESLPKIYADRRALKQILINILINAIKFTPDNGTITLTTKANDDYLEITVTDTGIGVSAVMIETITMPFIQAESIPYTFQEGTGLGLAIVKSLTELHQGKLEFESNIGEGLTVKVSFPLNS